MVTKGSPGSAFSIQAETCVHLAVQPPKKWNCHLLWLEGMKPAKCLLYTKHACSVFQPRRPLLFQLCATFLAFCTSLCHFFLFELSAHSFCHYTVPAGEGDNTPEKVSVQIRLLCQGQAGPSNTIFFVFQGTRTAAFVRFVTTDTRITV